MLGLIRGLRVSRLAGPWMARSARSANAAFVGVRDAMGFSAGTRSVTSSPAGQLGNQHGSQQLLSQNAFADAAFFTGNPNYFSLVLRLNTLIRQHNLPMRDPSLYAEIENLPLWMSRLEMQSLKQFRLTENMYADLIHKLNTLFTIPGKSESLRLLLQEYVRPGLDLVAPPKPVLTLDEFGRAFARGSRKTAKAQAWIVNGDGQIFVNGSHLSEYFREVEDRELIVRPFEIGKALGAYNVWAVVQGGGQSGQAAAIAVAVSRALAIHEPSLQKTFSEMGLTTIDRRQVERKKTGQPKARKKNTWLKR